MIHQHQLAIPCIWDSRTQRWHSTATYRMLPNTEGERLWSEWQAAQNYYVALGRAFAYVLAQWQLSAAQQAAQAKVAPKVRAEMARIRWEGTDGRIRQGPTITEQRAANTARLLFG